MLQFFRILCDVYIFYLFHYYVLFFPADAVELASMIFDVTSDVGIGFSPGVEIDETISSDSHVSSQPNHAALRHEVKNRIHHGGATDDEEKRIEENQCWDNSIFGAPHGIGGDGIFTFAEETLSNCSGNYQNQHLSSMSPEIAAAAVDALSMTAVAVGFGFDTGDRNGNCQHTDHRSQPRDMTRRHEISQSRPSVHTNNQHQRRTCESIVMSSTYEDNHHPNICYASDACGATALSYHDNDEEVQSEQIQSNVHTQMYRPQHNDWWRNQAQHPNWQIETSSPSVGTEPFPAIRNASYPLVSDLASSAQGGNHDASKNGKAALPRSLNITIKNTFIGSDSHAHSERGAPGLQISPNNYIGRSFLEGSQRPGEYIAVDSEDFEKNREKSWRVNGASIHNKSRSGSCGTPGDDSTKGIAGRNDDHKNKISVTNCENHEQAPSPSFTISQLTNSTTNSTKVAEFTKKELSNKRREERNRREQRRSNQISKQIEVTGFRLVHQI